MASRRSDSLVVLLKHAQQRLSDLINSALEPYGITGRELGVLAAVDDSEPASQQDIARRLGVDRTTMVAFVDMLEGKGLVERRPHALDRRRNVIELTAAGRETLQKALVASSEAERAFLTPLSDRSDQSGLTAAQLKEALRSLIQDQGAAR
jgi:DNA-binding MarR family transcriptional regulator